MNIRKIKKDGRDIKLDSWVYYVKVGVVISINGNWHRKDYVKIKS